MNGMKTLIGLLPTDSMGDPTIPGLKHEITYKYKDTTAWANKKSVAPILSQYDLWHQHSPFNDAFPQTMRAGIIFGKKRTARAGCVSLSLAKIMTHFEIPNGGVTQNGQKVDFSTIKKNCRYFADSDSRKAITNLLLNICTGCNAIYFYQGTFIYPGNAESFMRKIGFRNPDRRRYSWEITTAMLDKNKPIIIYGMPNYNVLKSHAWNIDGYRDMERTIIRDKYDNGKYIGPSNYVERQKMVHCDFGWGGSSNGYYITNIFNSNDKSSSLDYTWKEPIDFKYNKYLHIIAYE